MKRKLISMLAAALLLPATAMAEFREIDLSIFGMD